MIKFKHIILIAIFSFTMFSCEQEVLELNPFPTPDGGSMTGTSGSADFTKVATIGGSFTAGLMDGTLNDVGQSGSLGKMISVGLSNAGGSTTFNQPDINSANGYLGPGPDGLSLIHI